MTAGFLYLHHPSSLDHDTGSHPERAERIVAIERALEQRDWLGVTRVRAPTVERDVLKAVHPISYIDSIEALCASGGGMLDLDTVASVGSFEAALHATGGAVRAVDELCGGEAKLAFCALRPPGHHTERAQAMGFCLFNNVAVAAQHALDAHDIERVVIFDWDVHHGNGTNDIFYESDRILYISIHQSPLYPGTGALSDSGDGAGSGYTVNLPVPAGSGDAQWLSLFEQIVAPIARSFEPHLLLVSAGYDAHRDDPLASCALTEDGYRGLAIGMRSLSSELEAPLAFLLEGGYELGALARSVVATIEGAAGARGDAGPGASSSTLVAAARDHYRHWWPVLGEAPAAPRT